MKILSLPFVSCAIAAGIVTALSAQAEEFVHPGVAHSSESIAFAKARIAAGEQPWIGAWEALGRSRYTDLDWKPQPWKKVERGPSNNPDIGSTEFTSDGNAAYVHALCWVLSGKVAHAEKAEEILDAWSAKLEEVANHDARLLIGMSGYKYVISAELLKHSWDGWSEEGQAQFSTMLREVWYPVIENFYPSANGNWDASMIQVMLGMGVFLDDRAMFDRAKDYFLEGQGNGAIGMYFLPSGQCQETGRDQAHTQMGLNFLSASCETAWHQGIDLYSALDNRLLKGYEYTAKYNLGHDDVPYVPYISYERRYHYKKISDEARGRFQSIYERVFNHYHNRIGLEAPHTWEVVTRQRKEIRDRGRKRSRSSSAVETLMFAGDRNQSDRAGKD